MDIMQDPSAYGVKQWHAFASALAEAGAEVHRAADAGRTPAEQSQWTQSLIWTLIGELASLALADRDHPDWAPILNGTLRRYNANADATYAVAYIRGSGAYRILGRRGSTRIVHLQVGVGTLGIGDPKRMFILGDLNIDECEIAADGTFEVILSPRRPDGYSGAWLQLDASRDDSFALVRQVAYDWMNEVDAQLSIHRIDRPIAKTDIASSELTANIVLAAQSIRDDCLAMRDVMTQQLGVSEVNRLAEVSSTFPGVAGQAYTHGLIELRDDEVWVAECEIPPECPYWSVQLMDYAYSALDGMYTQASLNGHSAVADPDGLFRIVVCAGDPGVANWLDTSGQQRVQIRFRWYSSGTPRISTSVVGRAELGTVLPDTARIGAAERQAVLTNRAIGLQWRRRW
jgi:hypothetical protein